MARTRSSYLSLLSAAFSLTAFILMWIAGIWCNYLKFTDTTGQVSRAFGTWYYQYWSWVTSSDGTYIFESCHGYPDYVDIDPAWKAARAFDVITMILAIIILVMWCMQACCLDPDAPVGGKYGNGYGGALAPLYLLTALTQGLTLLLLSSNACKNNVLLQEGTAFEFPDTCTLDKGAKCAISAMVFWACAALAGFQERKAVVEEQNAVVPVSLTEPLAAAP